MKFVLEDFELTVFFFILQRLSWSCFVIFSFPYVCLCPNCLSRPVCATGLTSWTSSSATLACSGGRGRRNGFSKRSGTSPISSTGERDKRRGGMNDDTQGIIGSRCSLCCCWCFGVTSASHRAEGREFLFLFPHTKINFSGEAGRRHG